MGFLFESMCVRDLRVYVESLGGYIFHYRDKISLEANAIIETYDGRWAAVVVKLVGSQIEEVCAHL